MLGFLVLIAVAAIRQRDLFAVAMLFGVYSFMTAALFMDLDSVDVAFTEAAVGAGVTTVLLLSSLRLTTRWEKRPRHSPLLPLMVVSQALPVFAIAPLLVLWLGFGLASKIVMATIAIFFPVASAYNDGLARTDGNLLELARLYGANHVQQVALLRVPSALPALITGIRLAAVYAPIGALIGEWVGASSGLGYAMLQANARSQTAVMFACLFLLAAMSVLLRAGVDFFTRDLTPWVPETTCWE